MTTILLPITARASHESPAIETARLMYNAELQESLADYNVALAKANNEPTASARKAAIKRAAEDYKDARELAKDVFGERKELADDLNEDRYNPVINPTDFLSVAEIAASPNSYFPLVPGTTYNYRAETDEGIETISFEVTHETRTILGVTCIVVRDIVKLNGELLEDTVDWFAQDRSGNVWYFGENTAEYEGNLITTTAGSFEAGVEFAKPGIIMLARPVVGKVYRQEFALGEAEDAAEVLSLKKTVTVPSGTYSNCLLTEDFTPHNPEVEELKYYAPGVGSVLIIDFDTRKRTELISVVTP